MNAQTRTYVCGIFKIWRVDLATYVGKTVVTFLVLWLLNISTICP